VGFSIIPAKGGSWVLSLNLFQGLLNVLNFLTVELTLQETD